MICHQQISLILLLQVLLVEILKVLNVDTTSRNTSSSSTSVCTICHLPTLSVQCSHHTQPNQHLPTLTNIFSTRTEELASRLFSCHRDKNVYVKFSASCAFLDFCRWTVKAHSSSTCKTSLQTWYVKRFNVDIRIYILSLIVSIKNKDWYYWWQYWLTPETWPLDRTPAESRLPTAVSFLTTCNLFHCRLMASQIYGSNQRNTTTKHKQIQKHCDY